MKRTIMVHQAIYTLQLITSNIVFAAKCSTTNVGEKRFKLHSWITASDFYINELLKTNLVENVMNCMQE